MAKLALVNTVNVYESDTVELITTDGIKYYSFNNDELILGEEGFRPVQILVLKDNYIITKGD